MGQRTVSLYFSFGGSVSPSGGVGLWPTDDIQTRNPGQHCRGLGRNAEIPGLVQGGQQALEGTNPSDNAVAWPIGGSRFEFLRLRAYGVAICHTSNLCIED